MKSGISNIMKVALILFFLMVSLFFNGCFNSSSTSLNESPKDLNDVNGFKFIFNGF